MKRQFIYIVQTKACVDQNDSTYKIGRTTLMPNQRMLGYPKNSEIIMFIRVDDSIALERRIKELFDINFIKRLDMGVEYYTGDINDMRNIMLNAINYSEISKTAIKKLDIIKVNLENHNKKILLHRVQDSAILRNVSDKNMDQILSSVINSRSLENDVPHNDSSLTNNINRNNILRSQEDNIDVEPIILYESPEHLQEDNIETPIIHQNTLLSHVAHLQQEKYSPPQTTDNMSVRVDCDSILMFVSYIKKNKPSWYTPNRWMHSNTLYGYFVKTYPNIEINIRRFLVWSTGQLFHSRADKTINGKSDESVLLYPYSEIP